MKNLVLLLIISGCFYLASCKKDSQSENFKFLTGPTWTSDSLLANGVDASGPDGMLKNFKGDAKFNTDYTGTFGVYTGTWRFAFDETELNLSESDYNLPESARCSYKYQDDL
jgi:hypothetical protein